MDALGWRQHRRRSGQAPLEEKGASFRADALDRRGLTARETEVLRAATAMGDEADIAWELFITLHAVRERLARHWRTRPTGRSQWPKLECARARLGPHRLRYSRSSLALSY
jgi:hypothetical protein